jgi:hypothetical protein
MVIFNSYVKLPEGNFDHLRVGQPANQIKFHVNLAVLSDPAASHRLLKSLSTLLQSPPRSLSSDPFFMRMEETLP